MSVPECSILIAAYNAEHTIAHAVRSALSQTFGSLEVIVVDDGSSDDTFSRALNAGAGDQRLRVIANERNIGVSDSRNRALELARGTWVAILDADDTFENTRLEKLITLANAQEADLFADNLQYIDSADLKLKLAFPSERMAMSTPISAALFAASDRPRWGLQAAGFIKPIIRRDFLTEHGLRYPAEIFSGEDFHLYMQCLLAGGRLFYTTDALYKYTIYPSSLSRKENEKVRCSLIASSSLLSREAVQHGDLSAARELSQRHRDLANWIAYEDFVASVRSRALLGSVRAIMAMPSPPYIVRRVLANLRYDAAKKLGVELKPMSPSRTGARRDSFRVVFIDQVGQTAGGAERTLATFLKFRPRDIEPIAILFEDGDFAQELRDLDVTTEVLIPPRAVFGATRERGAFRGALEAPKLVLGVAKLIRKYRPDVIYTNSMKAHLIGMIAAKLVNTPCVVHFHDIFHGNALNVLRAVSWFGSRSRIACSGVVAKSMGVPKTNVIYGPVEVNSYAELLDRETARLKLGITNAFPVVALLGRINRWKGHDRFIRIANRVNEVLPVNFIIVGAPIFRDSDFVPEIEALVNELSIGSMLSFHPWATDVRDIYAAIDINTNCSTQEPFGRTIVEASAAGIPTVCFADSGASETITDGANGRTVEPGDEAAFAVAIIEILTREGELTKMSAQAKAQATHFDASHIARKMAMVIRQAASR